MSLIQEMQKHGLADCQFNRELLGEKPMKTAISIEEGVFDKSIVINFDGLDERGNLSHTGGYMQITRDDDCQCYNVILFNKHGDVLNETYVEFDFEPVQLF